METALEVPPGTVVEPAANSGQKVRKRRARQRVPGRRTPRAAIRRFNDLVVQFTAELGGRERLNIAEHEMVRQAAAIMLRAEQLQAAIVRGERIDPDELIRLSSEGRRVLRSLGIKNGGAKPQPPPWSPLRARLAAASAAASTPKSQPANDEVPS